MPPSSIIPEHRRHKVGKRVFRMVDRGLMDAVFPPSLRDGRAHEGIGLFLDARPHESIVRVVLRPGNQSGFWIEFSNPFPMMFGLEHEVKETHVPTTVMAKCGVHLRSLSWCVEASKAPRQAVIYFLKPEGMDVVKIGRTNEFNRRFDTLQTGCPFRLTPILRYEAPESEEFALHRRFHHLRIRSDGEWFRLSHDLLDFINQKKGSQ